MKHNTFFFFSFFIFSLFISCATIHTPRYDVDFAALEQSAPKPEILAEKQTDYSIQTPKNSGASGWKITEKADSAIRIIQISDFHSGKFGKNQKKILSKIKAAEPDIIVLTGDIFDFERRQNQTEQNVRALLSGIKSELSCLLFYVSGNHEYFLNHQNELSYMLDEYGVRYLKDEAVKIQVAGKSVVIAGIQDPFAEMTFEEKLQNNEDKSKISAQIAKTADCVKKLAAAEEENGLFTVLLAHRPEYIREYLKSGCFDLILSGHAHGGQWRIWPFSNGWYAPGQGFHPDFAGGRFDFYSDEGKPSVFIVSRGLSNFKVSVPRLFNGFELVVIDVKSGN